MRKQLRTLGPQMYDTAILFRKAVQMWMESLFAKDDESRLVKCSRCGQPAAVTVIFVSDESILELHTYIAYIYISKWPHTVVTVTPQIELLTSTNLTEVFQGITYNQSFFEFIRPER